MAAILKDRYDYITRRGLTDLGKNWYTPTQNAMPMTMQGQHRNRKYNFNMVDVRFICCLFEQTVKTLFSDVISGAPAAHFQTPHITASRRTCTVQSVHLAAVHVIKSFTVFSGA